MKKTEIKIKSCSFEIIDGKRNGYHVHFFESAVKERNIIVSKAGESTEWKLSSSLAPTQRNAKRIVDHLLALEKIK